MLSFPGASWVKWRKQHARKQAFFLKNPKTAGSRSSLPQETWLIPGIWKEKKKTLARCECLYLPSIFRYFVIYHSDFRTMARAVVCYVCLTNVHISRNRAAYRKPPTALHCGRIPVIHVASYPGGNGAVYRFYTRINILLSLTLRSKRSLRSMERLRVAFLGPAGSFSHQVRNFCSTCGQECFFSLYF